MKLNKRSRRNNCIEISSTDLIVHDPAPSALNTLIHQSTHDVLNASNLPLQQYHCHISSNQSDSVYIIEIQRGLLQLSLLNACIEKTGPKIAGKNCLLKGLDQFALLSDKEHILSEPRLIIERAETAWLSLSRDDSRPLRNGACFIVDIKAANTRGVITNLGITLSGPVLIEQWHGRPGEQPYGVKGDTEIVAVIKGIVLSARSSNSAGLGVAPCFGSRLPKIRRPDQESQKLGPPAGASFYFRGAWLEPLPSRLSKELKLAAPPSSPARPGAKESMEFTSSLRNETGAYASPGPCTLKLSSPYEDTVSGGLFPFRVALFLAFLMRNSVKTARDAACSFRSFSFGVEHSCLFLYNKSLVRVLSEPSRDVNGTYEVESVCLVFHLIRELRSEGLKRNTAIVKLGHTLH
ncbi:hypothetical protein FNV43_RR08299 [Rhamnella rubrinervis]|uniref:Uncharacterized protein n=1 Tax=Rhamnella rubrinervis TaxID=2594499 RepID=A0A8K0HGU8_9ROSA|nr:hypothetical protein FNV43_RR08299 [Rhamnella rubrinervis]